MGRPKGYKLSEETKAKIRAAALASIESRTSLFKKGIIVSSLTLFTSTSTAPIATRFKKGHGGIKTCGERNGKWKGGIYPKNLAIRGSKRYRKWRIAILERDSYTCVDCGFKGIPRSRTLHVDHIKPFAFYPELRFELSNGRTLCVPCHKKTDTWGLSTPNYTQKVDGGLFTN